MNNYNDENEETGMPVTKNDDYEVADNFGEDFDIDARPEQSTSSAPSAAVGAGWGDAEKMSSPASGGFPTDFKQSETPQVIKFLDPAGPFAIYKQHFISQITTGKRSFVCLGANCPLCTVLNHRAEDKYAFNIINLSAEAGMQHQILTATPRMYQTIHKANGSNHGPIDRHFWSFARSGVRQTTVYQLLSIKTRDLKEDWGLDDVAAEAFIANVKLYDRSAIKETNYDELLRIANEYA